LVHSILMTTPVSVMGFVTSYSAPRSRDAGFLGFYKIYVCYEITNGYRYLLGLWPNRFGLYNSGSVSYRVIS
jgi:hypothetical protein